MNKYSVLKLSNGEDIICRIVDSSKEKVKIEDPLLLDVQQITDKDGRIKESLGLIRWIKPFTEEEEYFIEKNSIVITVPASSGLSKYYEHVLKRLDQPVIRETLPDEIIEDDLDQMTDDEIIELMEDVKTRTIH
tara:strand:+ start:66 stop:467 length:402 start_codon:yes stop_codon:yes gene_type:complete